MADAKNVENNRSNSMANYGRGWDGGYGGQAAEAIDAYQERNEMEESPMAGSKTDIGIAVLDKATEGFAELQRQQGEKIIAALVGAYHNASRQMLTSEDLEWGHQAGVCDVAVRLGVYDQFVAELNRK